MVTGMGEKKEREAIVQEVLEKLSEKLPDILDDYIPQYMEEHRAELKRWFLNTDGFRSDEECKELQEACEKSEREKAEAEKEFQKQLKKAQERHEKELEETENRHATELKEAQEKYVAEHDALERNKAALERTQNALSKAQADCDQAKRHADDMDALMERLNAQTTRKLDDAHKAQTRAEDACKHYEANYAAAEEIVRLYNQIPDDLHQGLHSLVGDGTNAVTLLVRLSQQDVLMNLWDYTMHQIVHGDLETETIAALARFVEQSLALVNASRPTPLLAVQDIRIGERFQPNDMQKTPESRQQGTVRAVRLQGYRYQETGKLVKKSLVEVE